MVSEKPRLGETTLYPERYDPGLLVAIPRREGRESLPFPVPMAGVDCWTAYEISWLNPRGRPAVAIGEFRIPSDSANIVESKSLKLYLNSINQAHFIGAAEVERVIQRDLSAAFRGDVAVSLFSPDDYGRKGIHEFGGDCLDDLDATCDRYEIDSSLLSAGRGDVCEALYSHLLKSNCPVTGQPDWASLEITYEGAPIDRRGLLQYIVSFRQHQGFHENCVERIFTDIFHQCQPRTLSVFARYTRRGGLDINPYRSTGNTALPFTRSVRQ